MARISSRVASITGAASGLGAAEARRLAEEGAQVVLTDISGDRVQAVSKVKSAIGLEHDARDETRWAEILLKLSTGMARCTFL